ncbi:MAG: SixA phosphatase family protein [Pirellulaceae bacterium]
MKTLLLMRHAKSSWKDESLDDHDRPLNKRGKRDAPRMGELLRDQQLVPDYVLCSSARRARKTAECVAFAAGVRGETRITSELYMAPPAKLLEVLAQTSESFNSVLLIAHNPSLEELFERLTGQSRAFSTAAIAHLQLSIDSWNAVTSNAPAALIDFWQPRSLD